MMSEYQNYLLKSKQSLSGAESEWTQGRYDNAVNRAYYACFQAAVAALIAADLPVRTVGGSVASHQSVHSSFSGLLVQRRKIYSSTLKSTLQDLLRERIVADYHSTSISTTRADRAVRLSQRFVNEVASHLQSNSGETL